MNIPQILTTTATLLAALSCASAQAQYIPTPSYLELGMVNATVDTASGKVSPTSIRLVSGTDFHPNMGLEAIFAVSTSDGSATIKNVPGRLKINNNWGLYLKPKFDVSPQIEVFGRIGFASTNLSASGSLASASGTSQSGAYGLGLRYKFNKSVGINMDYMTYLKSGNTEVRGATIGVGYRF
jgi:opacity protein-like surface antigen